MAASAEQFEAAVMIAVELLLDGSTSEDILAIDLPLEDLTLILAEAEDRIMRRARTSDFRQALHLEQRRNLYKKALKEGEFAPALRALQDAAKLEGLYDQQPSADDEDETPTRVDPFAGAPGIDDLTGVTIQ